MMSAREIVARDEEEGAKEEVGQEERVAGSTRVACVGSTHSRFVASYAALRQIDSILMAPMIYISEEWEK